MSKGLKITLWIVIPVVIIGIAVFLYLKKSKNRISFSKKITRDEMKSYILGKMSQSEYEKMKVILEKMGDDELQFTYKIIKGEITEKDKKNPEFQASYNSIVKKYNIFT